jgi:hypothetical protein
VDIGLRAARAEALEGAGSSVSVSEEEESASQVSATGLDFGFCAGFWGEVGESLRCVRVDAISVCGVRGGIGGAKWMGGKGVVPSSLGVLLFGGMV